MTVHELLLRLAHFFISLGPAGLFLLGALDSSFLFFPLGNDLLVVLFTIHHNERMLEYVCFVTAGSALGCFVTDWLSRKGGKEGLKGRVSPRRLAYVQRQVEKRGWLMLIVAAIMPPPFPFTVFIIVAAALQYPRAKLLGIVVVGRFLRFLTIGALSIRFGRHILQMAKTPAVQIFVLAVIAISIGGTVWSIWRWVRNSRARTA